MRASPASPCHAEMAGQLETQPAITPELSYAWHAVSAMPDDVSMVPCTNAYLAARWGSCCAAMTACLRLWRRKIAHAQVFLPLHPYARWRMVALSYLKQPAICMLHVAGPRICRMPGGLSATSIQAAAQRTYAVAARVTRVFICKCLYASIALFLPAMLYFPSGTHHCPAFSSCRRSITQNCSLYQATDHC